MEFSGESKRNQIDRYVSGQMDEHELTAFEQRMREHAGLAESVHMHRDILEGIEFHFAQELKQTLIQSDQQKPKSRRTLYLAIAASVLLVIGAGLAYYFMAMPQNNSDLFTAYFEPYPNILAPITRSASDSPYADVMQAYEAGQYQAAITGFDELLSKEPGNHQLLFYRGVSLLAAGQAEKATSDFQTVIDASDPKLSTPAYWYLGLSQLKIGNTDQAKATFQKIAPAQGRLNDQAKEVFQKIK